MVEEQLPFDSGWQYCLLVAVPTAAHHSYNTDDENETSLLKLLKSEIRQALISLAELIQI